jgi:L,D-transpeptidase ErfK/SrfK
VELLLALILAATPFAHVEPSDEEVLGAVATRSVQRGESLIEIARERNVGFNAIAAANPGVDAFVPPAGTNIVVPSAWIVPRAAAPGTLVVNLSEMRLYLFPLGPGTPLTLPVGVGMEGWKTPLGAFKVVGKVVNPAWYPPASIRRENPELPARVPPGPDNPLGTHALRLSRESILIHGTDQPYGVGRKASHGCLRLYPEDIPHLFRVVSLNTNVLIVREPVKVGVRLGRVHVEVHDDPEARVDVNAEARRLLAQRGLAARVDADKLATALNERRGIPVDVTRDP